MVNVCCSVSVSVSKRLLCWLLLYWLHWLHWSLNLLFLLQRLCIFQIFIFIQNLFFLSLLFYVYFTLYFTLYSLLVTLLVTAHRSASLSLSLSLSMIHISITTCVPTNLYTHIHSLRFSSLLSRPSRSLRQCLLPARRLPSGILAVYSALPLHSIHFHSKLPVSKHTTLLYTTLYYISTVRRILSYTHILIYPNRPPSTPS